jgi:selenocysteine lyase/cysteine desulfurase
VLLGAVVLAACVVVGVARVGAAASSPAGHGPLATYTLIGPADPERRTAVFSLTHDRVSPDEAATLLESKFGIVARAGLHCAPRAAGRPTLRLSFGAFNSVADVDRAAAALAEVATA